jgi:YfiH family protein
LEVLTWAAFDDHDVDAFVTTREGGVSQGPYTSLNLGLHVGDDDTHVLRNRVRVADALGASLDDFVFCDQAHRPNVLVVTDEHRGRGARSRTDAIPRTDALVTSVPGIVLVVMVADCVPLILHDPVAGVLACVHAGWGGTVRGVTSRAVEVMRELGSQPGDIIAGIGPAIPPDRYQVGEDVLAAAGDAFGDQIDQVIRPDGTGKWTFDLWRANTLQLSAAGVPEEQVHLSALGTGPNSHFFSHRAENPCGRFAAVARLRGKSGK